MGSEKKAVPERQAGSEKKTADKTAAKAVHKGSNVDGKEDAFQPDPQYEAKYNAEGQVDIYGAKTAIAPPRPLLELGRQQYTSGSYRREQHPPG